MSSALKQAKQLAAYNNKMERQNIRLQAQYNSDLAQDNRDWQEKMANSAHQREIKDLKAAGLNPVLSVTGGQGATTPSGSAASVSKPNTDMSLPSKVMDMAINQMNNATQMQITAMQTANALTIAREQIAESWREHTTSSGDSYFGQYKNAREYMFERAAEVAEKYGINLYDPEFSFKNFFTMDGFVGSLYRKSLLNELLNSAKSVYNSKTRADYRANERRKAINPAAATLKVAKATDKLQGNNRKNSRVRKYYRDYSRNNYRFYMTR